MEHRNTERKYYLFDSRIVAKTEHTILEIGQGEKTITNARWTDQYARTPETETPDWEQRVSIMYPHVEYDPQTGKYRMWYAAFFAASPVMGYDWRESLIDAENSRSVALGSFRNTAKGIVYPGLDVLCCMESTDGENWIRPELGEFFYKKQNGEIVGTNIVYIGNHGLGVERNEHPDPGEPRYLMAGRTWETDCLVNNDPVGVAVSWSEDGIHWEAPITIKTAYECCPDIWYIRADTHNQLKYSPELGKYIVITRGYASHDHKLRQVVVMEAAERLHSIRDLAAVRKASGDIYWKETTRLWKTPEVTLDYRVSLAAQPYSMPSFHAAEGCYIGVVSVADFCKEHESWNQVHAQLTWSPDGKDWHYIKQGTPVISNADTFEFCHGSDYGMIYCAAPVEVGDSVVIYYAGLPERHYFKYDQIPEEMKRIIDAACPAAAAAKSITRTTSLKKLTLGKDRYAGYWAENGTIETAPCRIFGENLTITADVQDGGSLQIAVLDTSGTVIPGYGYGECSNVRASVTDGAVAWDTKSLMELQGQTVSFRIHLCKAGVYTIGGGICATE